MIELRATPRQHVEKGHHGKVMFKDGHVTRVFIRSDDSDRAAENRFHEMLHVLCIEGKIKLNHDVIRLLSKTYSQNQSLTHRILNFKGQSS